MATLIVVVSLGASALAQTLYTTPASFDAAIASFGAATVVNFDEIDASPVNNSHVGRPPLQGNHYAALGITFASAAGHSLYVAPGGLFWNSTNSMSVDFFPYEAGSDANDSLVINLTPPCSAIGFSLVDAAGGQSVQFLDSSGAVITQTGMPSEYTPYRRFVGIVSTDRPVAQISVIDPANDGDDVDYDDFKFLGPPLITSPSTATATEGQLFVYQVTATGTPTGYTATPLPAGLSFDSVSGILGGVPTNTGTTQIQLTASNSVGTGMKTLTLTVQPFPSSGPIIASGTSITGRTGVPFSFEVFTTGGSTTARLSATGLPPGLSADSVTGVISGTPTIDGSFGVTLTVTDGPVTFISTLQLTFTSDPAIPVITNPREATLTAGQPFTYTITTDSSDQSGTTFSLIGNLPPGLGFDPATGTISGTYNPGFQNGGNLLGNVQTNTNNSSGSGTNPLSFFQGVTATAVNISTRLAVGTIDNVLIGGFIVTGNAPKKVIARAIGPSLTAQHVPGALQDPTLELHDHTGALIATNDDWHTTQIGGLITADQSAAIQASTLAPTDNRESAMIVTLAQNNGDPASLTGHYTAIIRGKNGTTGAALVEVYDLGTASLDVSNNAQLANISTRGLVQTGDNVMIGGFIVRGDMPATVIVRAIGPSLAESGIINPLLDPTLELHDGTGAVIGGNDNWQDDPGAAQIQADNIAPSDPRESATIVTLEPGNYTAIVRGVNDTTGVALVEAYVLP
jgi:hypothetical protein